MVIFNSWYIMRPSPAHFATHATPRRAAAGALQRLLRVAARLPASVDGGKSGGNPSEIQGNSGEVLGNCGEILLEKMKDIWENMIPGNMGKRWQMYCLMSFVGKMEPHFSSCF